MNINLNNLSKKKDTEKNIEEVLKELDFFFSKNNYGKACNFINAKFEIPKDEIIFFFKKEIVNLLDFSKNEILIKRFNFYNYWKYFFLSLFHCFFIFIFRKKSFKLNYFELLIDHLDSEHELKHYERIIKKYNKDELLIRTRNKKLISKNRNIIFFHKYKNYDFKLKDLLNYISLIFISLYISLKYKINFSYLSLKIIDEIFFYKSFFKNYKIKNILMHQHYYSSNIKNYFFKKNDGKSSCLIQKNLNTRFTNGYFYHCDALFPYSSNATINNLKSHSNIKESVPVGSLFMERHFYNEIENNVPDLDLLYIAGTGLSPGKHYDTYENYKKDYEEHLKWLINISNDFPHLKVGIKHRFNNVNNFEYNFLKGSRVIKIDQNLNSYHVAEKAKFLCSWCSSMIIELNSIGKLGMFLDPGARNNQFLSDVNLREKISFTSYENFKNFFINNDLSNLANEYKNLFCLDSKEVSLKNINYLKKVK